MNPQLPQPDYVGGSVFQWPWFKFELPPEDLFTSLHDRFNTRSSAIQDPYAFHRDVVECADSSATIDDFYDKLAERKAERMNEIDNAWEEIGLLLGGTPSTLSCPRCEEYGHGYNTKNDRLASRWEAFIRLCRSMSSDRLVMFFDEYARDQRERKKKEREEAKRNLDRLWPIRKQARRREADGNEVKSGGPAERTAADANTPWAPSITEAQPTTLESPHSQPIPDGQRTNIPTPSSTLSSPSQDPQKTRQESNCGTPEAKEDEHVQRKRKRKVQ